MRFKLDENFSPSLVHLFQKSGFDAESVLGEGLSGTMDSDLFQVAKAENRCLITLDLDFSNILRFPTAGTPGIIVIRPSRPITLAVMEEFSRKIIGILADRAPSGMLWIVQENRLRIRKPEE